MRNNLIKISFFTLFVVLLATVSCSSGKKSSDATIRTFTFGACNAAPDLTLKKYYIDSIAGTIKNTDSINYTSNITKVFPVMTFKVTPSEIRINDVAWNRTDSIDATSPFKLTIVAPNGKNIKDYMVTVNKHTVNPDSIVWTKLEHNLPDGFENAKVFDCYDDFVFVGKKSDKIDVYSSIDGKSWSEVVTGLDLVVDPMSGYVPQGSALEDSIYVLGYNYDALYVFDRSGKAFVKIADFTGYDVEAILGEYKTEILILAKKDEKPVILSYHDGMLTVKDSSLPPSFPVGGEFSPVMVKYDMRSSFNVESMFIVGGLLANGSPSEGVHATDNGWYWSNVVKSPAPVYFTGVRQTAAVFYARYLFTFGGITEILSPMFLDMQVSYDNGFTWDDAMSYQQLPAGFSLKYGISALADNSDNIYLFGGYDENDRYKIEIYKGRMNSVDFKK